MLPWEGAGAKSRTTAFQKLSSNMVGSIYTLSSSFIRTHAHTHIYTRIGKGLGFPTLYSLISNLQPPLPEKNLTQNILKAQTLHMCPDPRTASHKAIGRQVCIGAGKGKSMQPVTGIAARTHTPA